MQERIRALQQLIDDPTGNVLALGVALTIAVLLVIILALLLLVAALPKDRPDKPSAEGRASRGGRRLLSRFAPVAILTAGVLAATGVWYQSTSTVAYCTRTCHAMAEPAEQWRESPHASVSCIRCHEGRLWRSLPQGIAGRTYSIYLEVTGATPNRRPVPDSICMGCHEGIIDTPMTAANGETYLHRPDVDAGRHCITCHGNQGHASRSE